MSNLLKTPQPARAASPVVKARRLSHLVLSRPDLAKAEKFFTDFGLRTASTTPNSIFMHAAGPFAYCLEIQKGPEASLLAVGVEVESAADLDALAALPGAEKVAAWPAPGGGQGVVLHDPSGRRVEAVCAQTPFPEETVRPLLNANSPHGNVRVNEGQRPARDAVPPIYKLGHVVLEATHFQDMSRWYTETLGLIPSDVEVLPDGSPAVCFFRFDCGDTPADHHAIAMGQSFADQMAHAAFELVDQDAVGLAQRQLRGKGYKHAWGIGRHIWGSQIFDYWRDPFGQMFEHYSDGDVFTADYPTGVHRAGQDTLFQWGPKLPGDFARPKMGPKEIVTLIRNVRRSPDLSFGKLISMVKALS